MAQRKVVLASQSPRRKELFAMLGIPFEVAESHVEENHEGVRHDFAHFVEELALKKALAVLQKQPQAVVIGADTIVIHKSTIFPKPRDKAEATSFLQQLSGRTHTVYTGVAIVYDDKQYVFSNATEVTFFDLDQQSIENYVASGDPLDKAGGYGIQTAGALFVKEITGDYYAVVGLPISALHYHLRTLGIYSTVEGLTK